MVKRSVAEMQAERDRLRAVGSDRARDRRYWLAILIAGRRAATTDDYRAQLDLLVEVVRPDVEPSLVGALATILREGFPPADGST